MIAAFKNISRVLCEEGVAGIRARLMHRRRISLSRIPDPARFSDVGRVLDNGNAELSSIICNIFDISVGAQSRILGDRGITLHVGWPDDWSLLSKGDIVISFDAQKKISVPDQVLGKLGLVLESNFERLSWFSNQPSGYPHYLYLPSAPSGCSSGGWLRYESKALFYLRRTELFVNGHTKESDGLFGLDLMAVDGELRVCLSLPEYPERRAHFESLKLSGFQIFDGFRMLPAWKGAAISYRELARYALDIGVKRLIVAQDDMEPAIGFNGNLPGIIEAFHKHNYDIFSGLVTVASSEMIAKSIGILGDTTLVDLDRSVGLVFNIFGERALHVISNWSDEPDMGYNDTIDQYISKSGLKFLTCVPPLVSHKSSLHSTIWEFSNARYDSVIKQSVTKLSKVRQTQSGRQD